MDAFSSGGRNNAVRVGAEADLSGLTNLLWAAFREDPLWSWAFPDRGKLRAWWRFLIKSALRYPWVFVAGEYAAASVWIPPEGSELTEHEEHSVQPMLEDLVGSHAFDVLQLLERFEICHPRGRPHYYLSLLGTHPHRRGEGLGMALLAENLKRIDDEATPAYLESSNPANDRRYEGLGFERVGEFATPDGRHTVATMWREPSSGLV